MTKRSLLAVAITALTSQAAFAAPFLPMDARGLAMGNTGVASAARAHAPAYNPSLLSQADADDDFALLFPQFGVSVADEDEMVDTAEDINDNIVPQLEDLFDENITGNFNDALADVDAAAAALEAALNTANTATIQTANDNFSDSLDALDVQINNVNSVTNELDKSLKGISGSPLSGRLGVGAALAIPSKKFAAAISLSGSANFSGRVLYSGNDSNLLTAYGAAAGDYVDGAQALSADVDAALAETDLMTQAAMFSAAETSANNLANYTSDPVDTAGGSISIIENGEVSTAAEDAEMDSQLEVMAISVAEVGLSFSREFEFGTEKVAIGITPKLQKVSTYHYVTELDSDEDIETDDIEDSKKDFSKVNLDVGVSWRFGNDNSWMLGLVAKNLLGGSFETEDAIVKGSPLADYDNDAGTPDTQLTVTGHEIEIQPQFRAGVAYRGDWLTAAVDVDLTENDPIAYENPTQFVNMGAEFDIWDTLQLRAGYRTNLSVSDADIVSVGLGLSPFGVHIDIAAMANPSDPEREAGVALETGFYF